MPTLFGVGPTPITWMSRSLAGRSSPLSSPTPPARQWKPDVRIVVVGKSPSSRRTAGSACAGDDRAERIRTWLARQSPQTIRELIAALVESENAAMDKLEALGVARTWRKQMRVVR